MWGLLGEAGLLVVKVLPSGHSIHAFMSQALMLAGVQPSSQMPACATLDAMLDVLHVSHGRDAAHVCRSY